MLSFLCSFVFSDEPTEGGRLTWCIAGLCGVLTQGLASFQCGFRDLAPEPVLGSRPQIRHRHKEALDCARNPTPQRACIFCERSPKLPCERTPVSAYCEAR